MDKKATEGYHLPPTNSEKSNQAERGVANTNALFTKQLIAFFTTHKAHTSTAPYQTTSSHQHQPWHPHLYSTTPLLL